MNWIPMTNQMPPDTDEEIFIRKIDGTEWHQTPANEIYFEVSSDDIDKWEWAYWKTIKMDKDHASRS